MRRSDLLDSGRLDKHYCDFRALVATAYRHVGNGRYDLAATYAQIAARFAWLNHTGLFASYELETLLASVGGRYASISRPARATSAPRTVLHVLTQTYQTGGHTQAVRSWLEQDVGRRHRICITRQGLTPVPDYLAAKVNVPADLVRLDIRPGRLIERAIALRNMAAGCDVVLLHTHPHDVIPLIAFAVATGRPPVVYANHADHAFWLGTGVTDLLMNMRYSGQSFASTRRGVDLSRSVIVPWPLVTPDRRRSREEAKRQLGIEPDSVLLVTAADASKYRPMTSPTFLDLVLPVLERHKDAVLLAAGPALEDAWLDAADRTRGRVRALGRVPDVTPLHEAADVYLDSSPISSLTSLLEAGSFGTPVLTYRSLPETCAVLGADVPAITGHLLAASNSEMFASLLSRAISDPAWRSEIGERTQQAIVSSHTGDGWRAAVADMYRFAASVGGPAPLKPITRRVEEVDLYMDAVMRLTGYSEGTAGALRDHLSLLPVTRRVLEAAKLRRSGVRPKPREVVPEWVLPRVARWRRTTSRITTYIRGLVLWCPLASSWFGQAAGDLE